MEYRSDGCWYIPFDVTPWWMKPLVRLGICRRVIERQFIHRVVDFGCDPTEIDGWNEWDPSDDEPWRPYH